MSHLLLGVITFIVSAFGTIVGAGGGFLLMPALMVLYPHESAARLTFISLFTVLVNATGASVNYARLRRIDYRSAVLLSACTIPSSMAARLVQPCVARAQFAAVFGAVLIVLGQIVIWRTRRWSTADGYSSPEIKPGWLICSVRDSSGIEYRYGYNPWIAAGVSLVAGFVGAFFGIGGGVLHVPVMTQLLSFPPYIAAATSILILAVTALTVIATDVIRHAADVPLVQALVGGLGAVCGAQVGTRIARRIGGRRILYVLAAALILAGILLLFEVA